MQAGAPERRTARGIERNEVAGRVAGKQQTAGGSPADLNASWRSPPTYTASAPRRSASRGRATERPVRLHVLGARDVAAGLSIEHPAVACRLREQLSRPPSFAPSKSTGVCVASQSCAPCGDDWKYQARLPVSGFNAAESTRRMIHDGIRALSRRRAAAEDFVRPAVNGRPLAHATMPLVDIRTIRVTRYVTPLREGGSLPAIVEADDDGMYVLKFRGAGQGPKALIAELVCGEIGRALGLPVPEIVFAELEHDLSRTEPDYEISALIRRSAGLNLALDYLPGSVTYDPLVMRLDDDLMSRIVWFDSYISNVDRTARNPNMLIWHRKLWLIDHGAALYFHHAAGWDTDALKHRDGFSLISQHALLHKAHGLRRVDDQMVSALQPERIERIIALIPDSWLMAEGADPTAMRAAYLRYLTARLSAPRAFIDEALRVR
jgi:hypothetical protein